MQQTSSVSQRSSPSFSTTPQPDNEMTTLLEQYHQIWSTIDQQEAAQLNTHSSNGKTPIAAARHFFSHFQNLRRVTLTLCCRLRMRQNPSLTQWDLLAQWHRDMYRKGKPLGDGWHHRDWNYCVPRRNHRWKDRQVLHPQPSAALLSQSPHSYASAGIKQLYESDWRQRYHAVWQHRKAPSCLKYEPSAPLRPLHQPSVLV